MRRDVLEERDTTIKAKKNAIKEKFFNLLMSDRFAFIYLFTILTLSIPYCIRLFSGSDFDRTTRLIESTVLWLASFKYYVTKRLHPDSRSVRWWFRIIIIISIMSTVYLILGMPGPRLPWKD